MVDIGSQNIPAGGDSRAQILEAAGAVFLAEGFERTSVDMIAATAHMSKQSIYELFPSKLALFEAAVRSKLDGARRDSVVVDADAPVEDALTLYALRFFQGFADPVNFGLFRANIAAANHFPELATELHGQRMAASRPMADYVEALIAQHFIRPCDPLAMAVRFGGVAVEGARHFLGTPAPDMAGRRICADNAVRLFLDGYRAMVNGQDQPPP